MQVQHRCNKETAAQQTPMFTAEEAGAILNLAAQLHDTHLSQEQLIAIAEEAGIPRETLQRAIEEYQRQQHQKALQQEQAERARRNRRHNLLLILMSLALSAIIGLAVVDEMGGLGPLLGSYDSSSSPPIWQSTPIPEPQLLPRQTSHPAPNPARLPHSEPLPLPRQTLAHIFNYTVYKQSYTTPEGKTYERVFLKDVQRVQEYLIGQNFGRVDFTTISPDGEMIALYDGLRGEVWTVRKDGKGLGCVARAGERINALGRTLTIISSGNPIVGWEKSSKYSEQYRLVLRAKEGLVVYHVVDRTEPVAIKPH